MRTDGGVPRQRQLTEDEAFGDWSASLIGPTPNPFAPETEVYTVPVGVELFHGVPYRVDPEAILTRPNFFGDWRTASLYHLGGDDDTRCIHRYIVVRPIVVLAVDSCETVRSLADRQDLWNPTDKYDPIGLTSAFRCLAGRRRPLRRSRSSVDRVLIPSIARVPGTAGLAARQLRPVDPDQPPFHAEIYLMEPHRYLRADPYVACLPRDVFPEKKTRPEGKRRRTSL